MNKSYMSHDLSKDEIIRLMSYWIRETCSAFEQDLGSKSRKVQAIIDPERNKNFDFSPYGNLGWALQCALRYEELEGAHSEEPTLA